MKYYKGLILGLLCFGFITAAIAKPPVEICSELSNLSRSDLNNLYIEADTRVPPEGEFASCELGRPDGPFNSTIRWIADFTWNGMKYSSEGNYVEVYLTKLDRLLGKVVLKATGVYGLGKSFFDGNLSYVNEYKTVSVLPDSSAWMLRDEFREIRPGIYLGMTYARFKLPGGKIRSEYVGTIAIINKELIP